MLLPYSQMIFGLMTSTAFLSAWVSNSATAAMMVPIAVAVMGVIRSTQTSPEITKDEKNFAVCVLLSIAYAASIGGMATLVGSPPNGIFARFVEDTYHVQVSFLGWMKVALPVTLLLLPATYFLLTRFLFPVKMEGIPGGREWIKGELRKLGPLSRGEKIVLAIFVLAALLWMFGPVLRGLEINGTIGLHGGDHGRKNTSERSRIKKMHSTVTHISLPYLAARTHRRHPYII